MHFLYFTISHRVFGFIETENYMGVLCTLHFTWKQRNLGSFEIQTNIAFVFLGTPALSAC